MITNSWIKKPKGGPWIDLNPLATQKSLKSNNDNSNCVLNLVIVVVSKTIRLKMSCERQRLHKDKIYNNHHECMFGAIVKLISPSL